MIDGSLKDILEGKDKLVLRKKSRNRTQKGKPAHTTETYANLASGHKAQMKNLKTRSQ